MTSSSLKSTIPHLLTFSNIACGFASLISLVEGRFVQGMWFMFLATIFDGIDGKVATLLNVKSEMGSVLDSLSDAVSFAVLPGVSLYLFYTFAPQSGPIIQLAAWVAGIGYTCAGVFREVRFMSSQTARTRAQGFIGLPIAPPAGLSVGMLSLANLHPETLYNPVGLVAMFGIAALNAYLMTISTINYLRWSGRAIAGQTAFSFVIGGAAYFYWGTSGALIAGFFIGFCSIYIVLPLGLAALSRLNRHK